MVHRDHDFLAITRRPSYLRYTTFCGDALDLIPMKNIEAFVAGATIMRSLTWIQFSVAPNHYLDEYKLMHVKKESKNIPIVILVIDF